MIFPKQTSSILSVTFILGAIILGSSSAAKAEVYKCIHEGSSTAQYTDTPVSTEGTVCEPVETTLYNHRENKPAGGKNAAKTPAPKPYVSKSVAKPKKKSQPAPKKAPAPVQKRSADIGFGKKGK
jgi:hypothetical protein